MHCSRCLQRSCPVFERFVFLHVPTHLHRLIIPTAAGQTNISLEIPRENKILIEANAIVRYFSVIGSTPWPKSGEKALKDYALIEFEESGQNVKAWDVAESIISKANFSQVRKDRSFRWPLANHGLSQDSTVPPSPAEIILFSTLYDLASTTPPTDDSILSGWFIRIIQSSWAKSGIEQAAVNTADKPVTVSKGAPGMEEKAERVFVKQIKEGLEMKIPKPGEDM